MNIYKRQAKKFISQFKLTEISSASLTDAIEKCGYKVIRYRPYVNKDYVYDLLKELDVLEFSNGEKAFTYSDSDNRFVFLCKDLSEEESCILLSHEAGHIFLHHMGGKVISGQDILNEYEANEFSHYLLSKNLFRKMSFNIRKNRTAYIIASVISLSLLFSAFICVKIFMSDSDSFYYVSENGEKYHRENCIYIKGKDNLKKYSIDELKSMGYQPCMVCIPDE